MYGIPYFSPADSLPAPLPSAEEVEAQADLGPKHVPGQHVVRVGEHYVVKYGWLVRPIEGENMLYVSDKTSIPVPRVYAIYQKEDADRRTSTYIVMEHIDGQPLNERWGALDFEAKEAIASQLRSFLDQLRRLPSPDGFCSLDNRPLQDALFLTEEEQPEINGPFKTEAEIAEALVLKLEREDDNFPAERASYYRRVLPFVLRGDGKPRFTHADLQLKNIMLRPDGTLVILDWQMGGWYPRYWEYAAAIFGCGWWADDFHAWVPKFLDEYPNEYLWLANIRIFLWF